MSYLTDHEIAALQESKLDRDEPYAIGGVTQGQLSIARHYGGCTYQGKHYIYMPATDELVRDDVVAWLAKYRKGISNGKAAPLLMSDLFG